MLRSTGTNCAAPRLSAAGRGRGADAGGRAHLQIDLAAQHHGRAEPFVHPHLQLDELEQELGDGAREEQPRLAVHPDAALLVEVVQDAAHAGLGGRHEVDGAQLRLRLPILRQVVRVRDAERGDLAHAAAAGEYPRALAVEHHARHRTVGDHIRSSAAEGKGRRTSELREVSAPDHSVHGRVHHTCRVQL